ncbi:hypothetical protein [Streptomyces sp. SPB162]|uniref:DUF2515 family protein n=1 Tax=Streptomyces sp. SPB162 TaxID=2940560 RepID=UPI0024061B12|nr:hypothetical protein [Streptomyces sp. SPB162]
MISSLEKDSNTLVTMAASIKGRFARYGIEQTALNELILLGNWAQDQLSGLRRRRDLAKIMEHDKTGLVQISDAVLALLDETGGHPEHPIWELQGQPGVPTVTDFYTAKAMIAAGVDPTTWDPSKGLGPNDENVQKVYAWYARMWQQNPNLQWAGMAKLAGGTVYAGMQDLDVVINHHDEAGLLSPFMGLGVDEAKWFNNKFLEMQKQIFLDMGAQHAAYLDGGMDAINALKQAGQIDARSVDAWQGIDSGDPQRIADGNKSLLMREQKKILPPYYSEVYHHDGPVGYLFASELDNMTSSPIPGSKSFKSYSHGFVGYPFNQVTNTDDRWDWISGDMLPAYQRLLRDDPGEAKRLIALPLAQRAKEFRRITLESEG